MTADGLLITFYICPVLVKKHVVRSFSVSPTLSPVTTQVDIMWLLIAVNAYTDAKLFFFLASNNLWGPSACAGIFDYSQLLF